jgi:hypothetical protein
MYIREVPYEELENSDLIVDCIYKGGTNKNISDEVLHKLLPKCGTSSGFRKVSRNDDHSKMAYVVLYTTMSELEWPDYLDKETGVFRYYGDNRTPGKNILDTKQGGNRLLEYVFKVMNLGRDLADIPPFFIFRKYGSGRDVQFLGLAAPGNPHISSDRDLVSFWRTVKDNRFQNYEAYFTVLDTGKEPISRKWLEALIYDHDRSLQYAPRAWKRFVKYGRNGIKALKAPAKFEIPKAYDQLQCDNEGEKCLEMIRGHYKDNPYGFERCATDIVEKMDNHFVEFSLTRPWRDGGRDAIGYYSVNNGGKVNSPIKMECALEAKCYNINNGVGVRAVSRLISRIRYRQFGVLVTTSFINEQAYKEVVEDGHPILFVTATDIAGILRRTNVNSTNIDEWLKDLDRQEDRFVD